MAVRKVKTTRLDIIKCGTTMFLERGYSQTAPRQVCEALDISTGNLTYYFPTKEHLLAVLVEMLCEFQFRMMEVEANEGLSSIMAICLEFATMAAMCEENEVARDFYLASYRSPLCLDLIRKNDTARAKKVFDRYCAHWTEEQFAEAELLVSGIEYANFVTVGDPVTLETRISGALNTILSIYNLPPEIREMKIQRVLSMDYRGIAKRVLQEFKHFVTQANEQALESLYQKHEKQ